MATWKKMAEAFGRAFEQHGFKGKKAGTTGSAVLDRAAYNAMGDPELNKAFKQGREHERDMEHEAYRRFQKDFDGTQTGEDLGRIYDEVLDEHSDAALEKEFDEGLNSAIARRKQDVKDWYGKDFPKAMVDEGADTFEDDLWRVIGELRDKGMSGADILNILKGTDR